MENFKRAIGLKIKETKEAYKGEVTELTPCETEDPMGGYGKIVSHVVIGLKTFKTQNSSNWILRSMRVCRKRKCKLEMRFTSYSFCKSLYIYNTAQWCTHTCSTCNEQLLCSWYSQSGCRHWLSQIWWLSAILTLLKADYTREVDLFWLFIIHESIKCFIVYTFHHTFFCCVSTVLCCLILSSSAFSSSTHKILVPPINISIVMMHVQGFIYTQDVMLGGTCIWGGGNWP